MRNESPFGAVTRILHSAGVYEPTNSLVMQLIDAVRETTPPPQFVTINMLSKVLQALEPSQALDNWAVRSSREIVKILSQRPEIQHVARLVDNEALWCTLEGTIAGMLLRVCNGKDLDGVPA